MKKTKTLKRPGKKYENLPHHLVVVIPVVGVVP